MQRIDPSRVADLVARSNGVAPVRSLARQGARRHAIDAAVGAGLIRRVRHGWGASPGADPYLVRAAQAGVVLSCVTLARRRGLWVLEDDGVHVAAPSHSGRVDAGQARVHWAAPVVPRHPDQLEDHLENALILVARCQPYESALAIWESALRMQAVDRAMLAGLALPGAALRLLEDASPWSDSGLETFVIPRLRWLKLPLRQQVWIAGHRVDLLIGDRLVLQIDGAHHVGAQREQDNAHDAALRLLGHHVIRVGYRAVVDDWPAVHDAILRAIAQGLHRAA